MSDCGVCIGGYDIDGNCDFQRATMLRARKVHRCCECQREIYPGEKYERYAGKFDGEFNSYKTCDYCVEIRDAFSCGETYPPFGELWSQMTDYAFPSLTTGCFDRLKTAGAKTYLRLQWMQWKGLAA